MNQLQEIQSLLAPELAQMNDLIRQMLSTPNELMNRIVTDYLLKKGKQIRPIMVLLSAKMFGEVNPDVLHAGAALEMLHNASLIHDDIVDETLLRRGKPTINASWGNHIAVLVGDFFVSNALAAGIATGSITIISALSALGKELSLGEIDQICNVRDHNFDEESYFGMIRKKTASLFRNCVRMGAEAVGATPAEYDSLMRYAETLGLCFQIKDDIFDYLPSAEIGKPTGNDLREQKVTLPLLYALDTAPEEESRHLKDLISAGDLTDSDIARLTAFAVEHGGIDYAYATMHRLREEAQSLIDEYPDTPVRRALESLFAFIISRNY